MNALKAKSDDTAAGASVDDQIAINVPEIFITGKKTDWLGKLLAELSEYANGVDNASRSLMRYQTEDFFKDSEKHLNGIIGRIDGALEGYKSIPYLGKVSSFLSG